jgi:integrase/recombinase XerD
MESDRGLSPTCRSSYSRVADRYMAWQFHRRRIDWRLVSPQDIWRYAAKIRNNGWKVKSVIDELSGLRQFLRFVHVRGGCSPALPQAVPSVNERPRPLLREYLSEEDQRRLLASFDRASPEGRRDYTMALCMVDLGLRCIEVARLRLGDLEHGRMMVPAAKRGRQRQLPLPRHVATALRIYIRARPATTSDFLFVGHTALIGRPLSSTAIRAAIDRAYRRCGFPWYGTHRLRRSFATRLYARGANMKEIADLLGHQLVTTTERYAQVDPDGLRALGRPWPM